MHRSSLVNARSGTNETPEAYHEFRRTIAPAAAARSSSPGGIEGLDPAELLARALHTVQPSAGQTAWIPPEPEELARLLPQYCIESLLGHGGMGAVYKGRQPALDRPVAIKLLPAEIAADEQFIARFRREARTLAKLQHSGIVSVYDFGQTSEGHLYFVMEFVEGTDLHKILHGPGLNPAQTLELISQVCDALHYAHSKGVIHRDIKPGNILVTTEGRVKLADFGLARPVREESSVLTGRNVMMGTFDYMAPEQRDGHADQRADIYALGVMLYEMLTGKRPHGVFDPPSHRVQLDIRLDQVVLKALQQEPERRYQQVSEMKTDVDEIRTTPGQGIQTPKPAPPPSRRKRFVLVAAAILVCAGAAGIFIWEKLGHRTPTPSAEVNDVPSPSPQKTLTPAESEALAAKVRNATKEQPFVNTLGMKFVPVPITGGPTGGQLVLFSVWATRVQDYAAFATETKREWEKPDFEQGPTHPAVIVSWDDAKAFCAWLTEREHKAGKLGANERYRLPTDHEWSCAVGIGEQEDAMTLPSRKSMKIKSVFPWGAKWPPPADAGNYFGEEGRPLLASGKHRWIRGVIVGYQDRFVETAPTDSFSANRFGLHDMGGNVWQWCEDRNDNNRNERVVRGAPWLCSDPAYLLSSSRGYDPTGNRVDDHGFRVVLCPASAAPIQAANGTAAKATPGGKPAPASATSTAPLFPAQIPLLLLRQESAAGRALIGSFTVAASGPERAVFRATDPGTKKEIRVIVEYPAGSDIPAEASAVEITERAPLRINAAQLSADGTSLNIFARFVPLAANISPATATKEQPSANHGR